MPTVLSLLEVSDALLVVLAARTEVVLVGVERKLDAFALLSIRG